MEDQEAVLNQLKKDTEEALRNAHKKDIEPCPDQFFDGDKFIPVWLGDAIRDIKTFKTLRSNGTIFVYENGVYLNKGEPVIREIAKKLLGNASTKNRHNEAVNDIMVGSYTDTTDPPNNLINVKNGMYNIETGELEPHNPNIFTISQIPVEYNSDSDCPKIRQFISEVVDDKEYIDTIQEVIGYALYSGYPIQRAVILYGPPNTGKSTLLNLIIKFLGKENISNVSLQSLAYDRFATANLYGKHANIVADLPEDVVKSVRMFCMLTGGDRVRAENKHKDAFSFWNYAKLIYSCNSFPQLDKPVPEFFKRMRVLVPCSNVWIPGKDQNINILEEITTEEEMSGLFNWGVEGLKRLLTNQTFTNEPTIEEATKIYMSGSDSLNGFVESCVHFDGESNVSKDVFYAEYVKWCHANNKPPITKQSVGIRLPQITPVTPARLGPKGARKTSWLGIKLEVVS